MIGYAFTPQDNDSYAFRKRPAIRENTAWYALHQTIVPNMSGESLPGVRRCAVCGELLAKWDEKLTGLKLKKRRYDVSGTYDGVVVVSEAFKAVYDSNHLEGLAFVPLPDDPVFFSINAITIVAYDFQRRQTSFGKKCQVCGKYEHVTGARPVFLKEGATIPASGFVRTDLEFAGGDEKHPLLLCGPSAGEVLRKAKMKGLYLEEF
jgi:hypothetical protein